MCTETNVPEALNDLLSLSMLVTPMKIPLWAAEGILARDIFFPVDDNCSSPIPPANDGVIDVPEYVRSSWICGRSDWTCEDAGCGCEWPRIQTGIGTGYPGGGSRQHISKSAANLPMHCWYSIENWWWMYRKRKENIITLLDYRSITTTDRI